MGGMARSWLKNGGDGLTPAYAPNPFTPINKGNFFESVFPDNTILRTSEGPPIQNGLSPPRKVVVVTVRENLAGAESIARGIDPARLLERAFDNRFHESVSLADDLQTGVNEVIGKKNNPTHAVQMELNIGEARSLNLLDRAKAKAWGYEPEKWTHLSKAEVYKLTQDIHHRARLAGYDLIIFDSTKNPGHTAYAVIDHFDTLLSPVKPEPIVAVDPSFVQRAKQSFAAVMADTSGKVLVPSSPASVLAKFRELFSMKKAEPGPMNSTAGGVPIVPSAEKAPVAAPPGKSVGPGAAHEFHRFTDYSEPALINHGKHGADSVFNQSFESRVTPEFTNGGQKLVRYMAENKIDTINGRQLTPHELNTLATEVSQKIMTSAERSNSFVKDSNGNKLIEVWDEASQGGMLFTKTGEFIEFTGRVDTIINPAHVLPPARAGPQLSPKVQLDRNGMIDYSKGFLEDVRTFESGHTHFKGKTDTELILVQYHQDTLLGDGRSAKYWTPVEQANKFRTIADVHDISALLPEWGPREVVSVARIPKGTEIEILSGKAIKQQDQFGNSYQGHGDQMRFKYFDPKWIVETRRIPK